VSAVRASILRRLASQHDAIATTYRELADVETRTAPAATYSSLDLPPDCPSRRAFRERCAGIVGATKRGHVWYVPRELWNASRDTATKASLVVASVDAIIDARRAS